MLDYCDNFAIKGKNKTVVDIVEILVHSVKLHNINDS